MSNLSTIVQTADTVCNCLPVVSTITNGLQLIYKLACRVDAVANCVTAEQVSPTLKREIQIHIISKEIFYLWIGLIPVVGNLVHLFKFITNGFVNKIDWAIKNNNPDLINLCLMNGYLALVPSSKTSLRDPKVYSNPMLLNQVFDNCEWTVASLSEEWALQNDVIMNGNTVPRIHKIIDYLTTHFPGQTVTANYANQIVNNLISYIARGYTDLAGKTIPLIPNDNSADFLRILKFFTFKYELSDQSSHSMTPELRKAVCDRCLPCSVKEVCDFFLEIPVKRNSLQREISSKIDQLRFQNPEDLEDQVTSLSNTLAEHDMIQGEVASHLLANISPEQNPEEIVDAFSRLFQNGEKILLQPFLKKFQHLLSVDHKLELLKNVNILSQTQAKHFQFLLEEFRGSLSEHHLRLLLGDCETFEKLRQVASTHNVRVQYAEQGVLSKKQILLKAFPQLVESSS